MASLLSMKRKQSKMSKTETAEQVTCCLWTHPSQLKASQYVEQQQQQHEADENALNEALEAKLRQLIVSEYSSRGIQHPVSLRIQGHLTISQEPATQYQQTEGTFWTADADICWRDAAACSSPFPTSVNNIATRRQRAERQSPVSHSLYWIATIFSVLLLLLLFLLLLLWYLIVLIFVLLRFIAAINISFIHSLCHRSKVLKQSIHYCSCDRINVFLFAQLI